MIRALSLTSWAVFFLVASLGAATTFEEPTQEPTRTIQMPVFEQGKFSGYSDVPVDTVRAPSSEPSSEESLATDRNEVLKSPLEESSVETEKNESQ